MRYLFQSFSDCPAQSAEIVIVGSGVAGLRSALSLAEFFSVTVITKENVKDSNTNWAQGGIAAVLSDEDTPESHIEDTLAAGDGLCDEQRVRELVEQGTEEVKQLIDWGADFDRDPDGSLSFGREGGHSEERIVHGRGDQTGSLVEDTLVDQVRKNPRVTLYEDTMMVDVIADNNRGYGLVIQRNGSPELLWFRGLILATGGLGQIYRETTNHDVVTGDGMAAAFRAGLILKDMEFIQFHPTTLYVAGGPRFLISEAVRGAGAKLVDADGNRFMEGIHPMAELAPRDIVSRAILRRMIDTSSECVYLDASHLSEETFSNEFPTIFRTCSEYGINPAFERIPIRPCAHYSMGGIKTSLSGQTSLNNVYALGEVSCTGIHGANRLASNSLLEGLVMGQRVRKNLGTGDLPPLVEKIPETDRLTSKRRLNIDDMKRSLKSMLWREAGILRDHTGLKKAKDRITDWINLIGHHRISNQNEIELVNLLMVGRCIVESALVREESRGAHFRKDFPNSREDYRRHSLITYPGWKIEYEE